MSSKHNMLVVTSETIISTAPLEKASELPAAAALAPRIEAIDGLRAFAMLMVFLYHVWQFADAPPLSIVVLGHKIVMGSLFPGFTSGVDLFIVLSGFCLFWPLCSKPHALERWCKKDYFKRRFWRIAPPYYVSMIYLTLLPNALVILYHLLGKEARWQQLPSIWNYATHILFIHTLFPGTWDGIQGSYWSLGLEAQFYLVFPALVFGYRKLGVRAIVGVIILSCLYRVLSGALTVHLDSTSRFLASAIFLGRWMEFAAGMLAAWAVARAVRLERLESAGLGFALVCTAVLLYIISLLGPRPENTIIPWREMWLAASGSIMIFALCATRTGMRRLFTNRLMSWLGLISYSLFLIHQNTIFYFSEFLKKVLHLQSSMRFLVMATFGLAFITFLAAVFFKLFEAPFLKKKVNNRGEGRKPVPA